MGKENATRSSKSSAQANDVKFERATIKTWKNLPKTNYHTLEDSVKLAADKERLKRIDAKLVQAMKSEKVYQHRLQSDKTSPEVKADAKGKLAKLMPVIKEQKQLRMKLLNSFVDQYNLIIEHGENKLKLEAQKAQHEVTLARLDSQRAEQRAAHANLDSARATQRAAHADVDAAKAQLANSQAQAQQLKAQYDHLVAKRDGYLQEIADIEADRQRQHAEIDRRAEAILNGFVDDTVARFSAPKPVSVS